MKYCFKTTTAQVVCCSYPACLEKLNDIIVRDGYDGTMPFFENNEVAINCDSVEKYDAKAEGRKEFNKSMDIAFGISNAMQAEMLLVELRLNYVNPNNLDRKVLVEKMNGTLGVIKSSVPIHNKTIFVFTSSVKAEARNRLARMDPKVPSSFIVMDINELKAVYFN
jgi:hypothetical protein